MLVSAIQHHESAIGIHISLPSWASLPPHSPANPSRSSQSWAELAVLYCRFPLAIYFTHGGVYAAAAAAKSLQSCPNLCDPIDGSPPGSPVPGILQARTLEWVAISFSNAWKWKVKVKLLTRVRLFATPWTAAYQAPPSIGFSRQEYWSGLPLPSLVVCINQCYFPNSSLSLLP